MTVQATGREKDSIHQLDMTNHSWFSILKHTDMGEILKVTQLTNDPIVATAAQSKKCAMALIGFKPDDNWFKCSGISKHEYLLDIMSFFKDCGQKSGFRTY